MRPNIVYTYSDVEVSCQCGNTFTTRSVLGKPLHVEICSNCHPAYTGMQKTSANEGRVQRFNLKYSRSVSHKSD